MTGQNQHLMDLLGEQNINQSRRLSLSLGSHRSVNTNPSYMFPGEEPCNHHHHDQFSDGYGGQSFSSVVGRSRYLKAAQSLLEETVNVGRRDIDVSGGSSWRGGHRLSDDLKAKLCSLLADKHDLDQPQIVQLLSLLDQVDGRYAKYCHQMEELVASFEAVAGLGAAKPYTAQALQAMTRHFCNLRHAILSQITKRIPIGDGLSQLSLLDGDNRMIQSQRQAWRPIRGLPDTSVAILRSWLMEHFLHPYPNDSEKLMLSSQTGLTKNQVSNWFINARVRLWKPMIEEIYREEFGDSSEEPNQEYGDD